MSQHGGCPSTQGGTLVCGRDPFQNPAVLRGVLILPNLVYARLDNSYVRPNEVGIVFDGLGESALGCKQHRSTILVVSLQVVHLQRDPYERLQTFDSIQYASNLLLLELPHERLAQFLQPTSICYLIL